MTNFRTLSTAAAALTLGTLMSTAAFAEMTCGDYNAMSADDQSSALAEMGQEGARDAASGEDATEAGVGTEQSATTEGTVTDDMGKEARNEAARGDDEMAAAVMEHCMGGDDLMVKDAMHPTAGKE
jgi:hypothetical protein